MWYLGKVNNEIVDEYQRLNDKINALNEQIDLVLDHDNNLYNSVFAIDSLDTPLSWEIPDDEYYSQFAYGRYADIMVGTEKNMDALAHRMYGASLSLDRIERIAKDKDSMIVYMPTSWPIEKSKVKHIGAFGWRLHPILHIRRMHYGIDLSGARGTPIYATGDGVVEGAEYGRGYGRQIIINHSFGYKTRYAHLSKILVEKGDKVRRGQLIGELGNTGLSKGPHLHYEVILSGKPVNPMNYLVQNVSPEEFNKVIESVDTTTFEAD